MNAKVLALLGSVREGFAIASVEGAPQGGVRIHLARGRDARIVGFASYEVPAILQQCCSVGFAK